MKKRKKQEPIVLDSRELMPTTIGSLETKENGPIFVILLILFFGACIYFLPNIISFLNSSNEITTPPVVVPPSDNGDDLDDSEKDPITYLAFSSSLTFQLDGFLFSDFLIDNTAKILNFTLTRESGSSLYFKNRKVYLELYSSDNKLLQRIKISSEEISNVKTFQENIAEAINNGTTAKLAIREITSAEYPNISLQTNVNQEGLLTCIKGHQEFIYSFVNEAGNYLLNKIEESNTFLNTDANYQNTLTTYTTLSATYQNINGITSDLIPISSGFQFDLILDLGVISSSALNRYFSEEYYYQKNTQAKVIAFELESLGYSCT